MLRLRTILFTGVVLYAPPVLAQPPQMPRDIWRLFPDMTLTCVNPLPLHDRLNVIVRPGAGHIIINGADFPITNLLGNGNRLTAIVSPALAIADHKGGRGGWVIQLKGSNQYYDCPPPEFIEREG